MVKKILISAVLLFVTTLSLYAQEESQLKRTPYKLTIPVDTELYYQEDIKATAYVLPDNTIQLYPGETIFVEVTQVDGVIKTLKAVKEIKDSSKTLIISFTQTLKGKVHDQMMLKIKNPFANNLLYDAIIFMFKQNKWVKTDVYPVYAGVYGIEMWPDLITSIAIGNWKFKSQ